MSYLIVNADVAAPLAFTGPFNVAPDAPIPDATPVTTDGAAAGVTGADAGADGTLSPTTFVALTVNVYGVPFVKPITVHDVAGTAGGDHRSHHTRLQRILQRPHRITRQRQPTRIHRRRPRHRHRAITRGPRHRSRRIRNRPHHNRARRRRRRTITSTIGGHHRKRIRRTRSQTRHITRRDTGEPIVASHVCVVPPPTGVAVTVYFVIVHHHQTQAAVHDTLTVPGVDVNTPATPDGAPGTEVNVLSESTLPGVPAPEIFDPSTRK